MGKSVRVDDKTTWRAFEAEALKCQCKTCKAITTAIFAGWSVPECRTHLMNGFLMHVQTCYYHRYQAHQDG